MFYISRSLAFIFKNSIYYWHQRVGAHYVTFVFLQKEFSIQCPVAFTEDLADQRYPKHRVGKHDGVCRDRVWQDEHHQDNQEEHQVYHLIKADKKLAIHIQILTICLGFLCLLPDTLKCFAFREWISLPFTLFHVENIWFNNGKFISYISNGMLWIKDKISWIISLQNLM